MIVENRIRKGLTAAKERTLGEQIENQKYCVEVQQCNYEARQEISQQARAGSTRRQMV
jgi:hypothetical protein